MKFKKILSGLLLAVIFSIMNLQSASASVSIISLQNNSIFTDNNIIISFEIFPNQTYNCSLYINQSLKDSLNEINSGNFSFEHSFPSITGNTTYNANISCINSSSDSESDYRILIISIEDTALSFTECPSNISDVFIMILFFIISLALIAVAFAFNSAITGIFGSLSLFMSSIYISPCGIGFGIITGGLSIILILIFAFSIFKQK